jgi:small subunit ribosomal protein S2
MHYVNQRWLGGTLTNFATIRKRIQRLRELEEMAEGEGATGLTKKEIAALDKERSRLSKTLSGIKSMERLPQALFVIDTNRERIAVAEANKLKIPVIAIVDTNCDPQPVDFPIPGNDDAIRAIQLFSDRFADCLLEAREVWEATRRDRVADGEKRPAAATPQSVAERVRAREARRERVRQKAQRVMGRDRGRDASEAEPIPASAEKGSGSE